MGYNSDDWGSDDFDSIDSGTDVSSAAQSTAESYGGGDSSNEVDDTGGYSLTYEQARTAGVPVGPRGSTSDPFAGTIGIAAPRTLPSGVVDYMSPNLLTSLTAPRSMTPQQAVSKMGIQGISPYSPDAITFANNQRTMTVDPLGGVAPVVFNMGRTQQQVDDRSFFDRFGESIGDRLGLTFQNQRAGLYDPMFDRYQTVSEARTMAPDDTRFGSEARNYMASTRLDKVSDNPFTDLIANALAAPIGSTVDSATFVPATGGEEYLYQSAGGLLGMIQDPTLRPMSEVEAESRNAMGGDGGDQPLIIPQEVAEVDPETGEPTAFPAFTPRQFEYEPYVGKFYTIPSRFTKPYGLLG